MLKTKYITENDYYNMRGKMLSDILQEDIKPEIFISMIEDDVENYLFNMYRVDVYRFWCEDRLTDYQKEMYKKAIICQIDYVLENGRLVNDSGYNPENGQRTNITSLSMSENTKIFLRRSGLATRVVGTHTFGWGGY